MEIASAAALPPWPTRRLDSRVPEIAVPELPCKLEQHQGRSDQHDPITGRMSFAKVVKGRVVPADDQSDGA
jgi:hypothetical protein